MPRRGFTPRKSPSLDPASSHLDFIWTPNPERQSAEQPARTEDALVDRELGRYKVDIAAFSKTRFSKEGQLEEVSAGYTFF
ncbi:hypothetical protein SprV_0602142100 [Sparganum proliferum]